MQDDNLTAALDAIGVKSIEELLPKCRDILNTTYGLDPDEPIGSQLALQGFLTNEEGDALDRAVTATGLENIAKAAEVVMESGSPYNGAAGLVLVDEYGFARLRQALWEAGRKA